MNIRKLAREYENLQAQIDRGKLVGYYQQGTMLVPKYVPWNGSQRAIRERKAEYIMKQLSSTRPLYRSEAHREPAIATVNEQNVFVYVPLSKTGLLPYGITAIRQNRFG